MQSTSLPELLAKLRATPHGLSQVEAQKRLTEYGPNEVAEEKANPFLKFLGYFWGPIPWMIEAAVILSALARHWPDFGIILVLLLANFAARGFRSLGVARTVGGAWQLAGVLSLFDPPRQEAEGTIAKARQMMTPGLSVIIVAMQESRRIFQRMNSHAIYRIAETLRVLLFMTLAILVFGFYPLTAVMIVMLALLNDGAILSIAYDNVHHG